MEKTYQQFHRLKKDIALKLLTIQDSDCLGGAPDDFVANGTNNDVLNECFEMMAELGKLQAELVKHEGLE